MHTYNKAYKSSFSYNAELNPLYIKYIQASHAVDACSPNSLVACELGFGQGVSLAMHAMASSVQWWGCDFDADQVAFTKRFVELCDPKNQPDLHLSSESIEEFVKREDLPDFDYICLNNVWSYVDDSTQAIILDFIYRKLKIGGMVYISYAISPGTVPFESLNHLMRLFLERHSDKSNNPKEQLHEMIAFLLDFCRLNPIYINKNPGILKDVESLSQLIANSSNDTAITAVYSELFNKRFSLTHRSDIIKNFDNVKLQFLSSAKVLDQYDIVNFTPEQLELLEKYKGSKLRETLADLILNKRERSDIFVKGSISLNPAQARKQFENLLFVLTTPVSSIEYNFDSPLGNIEMLKELYDPIINSLADHRPHSFKELCEKLLPVLQCDPKEIESALWVLIHKSYVSVATKNVALDTIKRCRQLNKSILNNTLPLGYLFCPVTMGGIPVDSLNKNLLAIYFSEAKIKPATFKEKLAVYAATLDTEADDNLIKEIAEYLADSFYKNILPAYQALLVV